jgi:hypothetical protein
MNPTFRCSNKALPLGMNGDTNIGGIKSDFSEADLHRANLSKANLSEADLRRANLSEADLSRADLSMAYLSGAILTEAILRNACLDDANFERATVSHTIFGSVDLSSCTGLDSVGHNGPSTLGIDSIIYSKGRILPDEWIDYIPSLIWEGIPFFSCFISYSTLDKPFAIRLHAAFSPKGYEKQLFQGDDISRGLERGIYLWDKFLLCASLIFFHSGDP